MAFLGLTTGRAGSVYITRIMHYSGMNVTHETWFNERNHPGGPDTWPPIDGEWSAQALRYVDRFPLVSVFHQVRHPLKVVGSYLTTGDRGMMHDPRLFGPEGIAIADHARLWEVADPLERACLLYLRVNRMIEEHDPVMWWRLEDVSPAIVYKAGVLCGLTLNEDRLELAFDQVGSDVNTRNNAAVVGWSDIPHQYRRDLQSMADQYGYRN